MKLFIAQPMNGLSEEDVLKKRSELISLAQLKYGNIDILDSYCEEIEDSPIKYLAKSIYKLADADLAIFAEGWKNYRGCRLEHSICKEYGIKVEEV